jgi:phospholipid/cholesterol/gamma-HCH transport system substrate-binding protein
VRDLRPSAAGLAKATPDLTTSFKVLNDLFNMVAYNPNGKEGPSVPNREEGPLFWIAWGNHVAVNLFYSADAHGNLRPAALLADCDTFRSMVENQPQLEFLLNLTPLLTSQQACGAANGTLPALPKLSALKNEVNP